MNPGYRAALTDGHERSQHFRAEVDMTRRVEKVQEVGFIFAFGLVQHAAGG